MSTLKNSQFPRIKSQMFRNRRSKINGLPIGLPITVKMIQKAKEKKPN
jgi:hypothetical protein